MHNSATHSSSNKNTHVMQEYYYLENINNIPVNSLFEKFFTLLTKDESYFLIYYCIFSERNLNIDHVFMESFFLNIT